MPVHITQVAASDVAGLRALTSLFGEVFDDAERYHDHPPSDAYLRALLARDTFVAIVARDADRDGDRVVGGLAAYELPKFEQERSEFYIFDLAVASSHRRQGIATALIGALQDVAHARGGWVVFVQANTDEDDAAAIALYSKLGTREAVLHFDIPVPRRGR